MAQTGPPFFERFHFGNVRRNLEKKSIFHKKMRVFDRKKWFFHRKMGVFSLQKMNFGSKSKFLDRNWCFFIHEK
jgi:hypothetical protein